jgi:hypothetical protein
MLGRQAKGYPVTPSEPAERRLVIQRSGTEFGRGQMAEGNMLIRVTLPAVYYRVFVLLLFS